MPVIEFQVPKNTPKSNVYRETFDLGVNARFIKNVKVTIPFGHKGLAYLRVYYPGGILIPAPGSSVLYVRGENEVKNEVINKTIEGPPFNVYCEGYNEDIYLPHTFIIDFEV